MKILTASHTTMPSLTDYQVSRGFLIVDITIKSRCDTGWILAPIWDLVNNYKANIISQDEYTVSYMSLMSNRFDKFSHHRIMSMNNMNIILICYCPVGEFCHRYLAADFLVKRLGATYFGEHQSS